MPAPPARRRQPSPAGHPGRGAVSPTLHEHEAPGAVGRLGLAAARSTPARRAPPAGRPRCRRSGRVEPSSSASPITSDEPTTRGSSERSTPKSASSSSSQAPRSRSSSIVREALVTSVTCSRAAGQPPDEPRVDRAEGELARPARRCAQQPLELRRREVRVGTSPVRSADQLAGSSRAPLGGAPVLPHDRVCDRPAGAPLPDERRLALVRDPDRDQLARRRRRAAASASDAAARTLSQISSGSCSTQPG